MPQIEEEIQKIQKLLEKYKYVILIIWLVVGVILLITGSIPSNTSHVEISKFENEFDYTQCKKYDVNNEDSPNSITCNQYLLENKGIEDCLCYNLLNLNFTGEITLYLELPTFDQNSPGYKNSKDDDQLRGIITETPSFKCEPFRYNNGKPIVPCGAIANSMFNDEVKYIRHDNGTNVELQRYGMLSAEDKAGFRNPENLNELKNFSKPINWTKGIYELDMKNADNNGFQNEYFISWMRTDWKRKHIARIKGGLPADIYQMLIIYRRSPVIYNGTRKLIFSVEQKIQTTSQHINSVSLGFGIVMLITGALCVLYMLYAKTYLDKKKGDEKENTRQNVNDTNPPPLLNPENNTHH